jgi:hypothetical protein
VLQIIDHLSARFVDEVDPAGDLGGRPRIRPARA